MPSGLVEDHHGVGVCGNLGRDLGQMQVHGRGVDIGQDEGRSPAAGRAHRSEDVGGLITLVARLMRPGAAASPLAGQGALLADPAFVLEPCCVPPRRGLPPRGSARLPATGGSVPVSLPPSPAPVSRRPLDPSAPPPSSVPPLSARPDEASLNKTGKSQTSQQLRRLVLCRARHKPEILAIALQRKGQGGGGDLALQAGDRR